MSTPTTKSIDLQEELLNRIMGRFDRKADAVKELSDHFGVGKDAIYRRLRGDTLLTPDEILALSKKYNISLDGILFEDLDTVFFSFNAFSKEIMNFDDYLASVEQNLDQFGQIKDAKVYFNSNEIPFFYYCFFPELISFKLYVWGRNIWNMEYLQEQTFHTGVIPFHAIEMSETILKKYLSLSTTEMWSLNLFDNTLNQIEYYANTGGFKEETDALLLCDKLVQLAEHFSQMAAASKKLALHTKVGGYGNFTLYQNEMISTNNFIYVKSPRIKALFTVFGSPNYLRSSDERICKYTEEWLDKIEARSTPLTNHADRDRNWFFKGIKRRIDHTRTRIKNQLEGLA